jgi:methyl-accepting chemotaxis protein
LTLPKLSIAAKLYVIFALMAATTLALSTAAVRGARHHAALTDDFQSANGGSLNVERVEGLVFAATAEMHAITLAVDTDAASKYIEALETISDKIGVVTADWQGSVGNSDAVAYSQFAVRLSDFQNFASDLVRIIKESGPSAALRYASQADAVNVRSALTKDLDALGKHYSQNAQRTYTQIDEGIDATAMWLSVLAGFAVLLAIAGILIISRGVARPIGAITRVTEAVAAGEAQVAVPYAERRDEIGALARAIAVFQRAMRHNEELNRTVVEDAETRSRRQEDMSGEISRFSAEVEATLAELGRISDQMLAASTQLGGAADDATAKTARASAASAEASSNVRDIASAADELSASVNEIDRQVAQSNAIATKAVNEAGSTNLAVKELDEAAARIGDVIKLITDIAEQTNLLALNATIEAARAGEAGRGFAVVAGEVKALAGQTSRATEEIATQIAGMQRATTRSIDAINAIEAIIREIGEISGAIAAAVTEQGAATQEIARSVEIAARRTVDTADEVNLVGSATEDTRASAGAVKAVADDLGNVAGRIRAQVDQFFERISA